MEQIELRALEDKCIQEYPPTCTATCPLHVDVRALAAAAGRGDFTAARAVLQRALPFPGIISRVCDQPCAAVCKRSEAGDPIAIQALERACLAYGDPPAERLRQLPRRGRRVAICGGGLSGLTAAFDLARKGYAVTIFEATDRLGGSALQHADLPEQILIEDLAIIAALGVEVRYACSVDGPAVAELSRTYDAIYIATGAQREPPIALCDAQGQSLVDPVTFAVGAVEAPGGAGLFAGGCALRSAQPRSPVTSASDGRRAAISIDRYLQRVSLTASRANEGSYRTRLYTNTSGVEPLPATPMGSPASGYDRQEAVREAQRCIQCECMECVKVCAYLEQYGRYPRRYVREIYNNLSIVKGERRANRFINSCSLCGLCAEVCPEGLDMGAVCKRARRAMVEQGRMPASAHDFALRDMQFSNSERFALARNAPGKSASDYLFFPGCQLCASAPDLVERAYADLRGRLGARVGLMLRCCGAPADAAGRADLAEAGMAELLADYRRLGSPLLIVACPGCTQLFRASQPEIRLISLWDVYDTIGAPPGAPPGSGVVAVHDPCRARHEAHTQESVRHLLARMGYTIEELELSRERTECCGYGGHMWLVDPDLARAVGERRAQASPRDYVTYCATCRDALASHGKRTFHMLDLVFGVGAARPAPTRSQRRERRAQLRSRMLSTIWGETMEQPPTYASVALMIPPAVATLLEERYILTEDLQRVIEFAERSGAKLLNKETGHWLACYRPSHVTYWVEYTPLDGAFVVHNAYSHRMEIVEDTRA